MRRQEPRRKRSLESISSEVINTDFLQVVPGLIYVASIVAGGRQTMNVCVYDIVLIFDHPEHAEGFAQLLYHLYLSKPGINIFAEAAKLPGIAEFTNQGNMLRVYLAPNSQEEMTARQSPSLRGGIILNRLRHLFDLTNVGEILWDNNQFMVIKREECALQQLRQARVRLIQSFTEFDRAAAFMTSQVATVNLFGLFQQPVMNQYQFIREQQLHALDALIRGEAITRDQRRLLLSSPVLANLQPIQFCQIEDKSHRSEGDLTKD